MKCIIIEDQPPAQRILKKYIEELGSLSLRGTFSDAVQALDFLKAEEIDLLFLDIHLPKMSGIDFLKAMPKKAHVILTTAFADYALQGYELDVVDYLLKPFSFQRFVKAVAKVPSGADKKNSQRNEVFLKSGYEHIRIELADIVYIKSDADYTEVMVLEKRHLSNESLRYWLETLDEDQFVRIHKSYIINTAKINRIVGNQIYLSNNHIVPIGRTYKDEFLRRFVR